MKKAEYLRVRHLLETQGPLGATYTECVEADRYLKEATYAKLERLLAKQGTGIQDREFILMMVHYHYGSIEVDQYLSAKHAYPLNDELPEEI